MSGARQQTYAWGSLAVLVVGFIAAVIASNTFLRGIKLDLTENRLYTLAPGARALLGNLSEPINLYFFFSDESTADIQVLRSYATRVEEMLEEFVLAADGQLRLERIDPAPFSEDEDRAAAYGLADQGLAALGGDSIYFGLAATNAIGDEAVIDVFDPDKESSLEYDLARLIYSLSTPDKNVIGLISGLPMTGGFDPQTQQMQQPWIMSQQIRQLFEVRTLASSLTTIDDEIGLLWIVHPTSLSESALYAIDQFILGGGRALIFVDPLAEVATLSPDPTGAEAGASSSLEPLFSAWGLEFDPTRVVADKAYALAVNAGGGRTVVHIGLLGLDGDALADDEVVTTGLASGINLGTAGSLRAAVDAGIELVPLLESSADSALMPAADFRFLTDPLALLDDFAADGETHVLAARIAGPLRSAFPDGPPGADDPALAAADNAHRQSAESSNLIVVADVDVLSDRLWVQRQRSILGREIASAFAANGDFVANAIANLAGAEELIGLKSRETFVRPFDRVEALQREADARFRETEQELQARLAETESRLADLQQAREDQGSLLMSAEQQAEVDRFREEQLRIRRELRSVQRELDSSIDNLGARLKLINILVIPLALALIAVLGVVLRRRRPRARGKQSPGQAG
jgi:ABC-type uncharacterized transport system involved in gliding motility auxiliary subunit